VRTGNFALYPRHNRDGRIGGWTGTAELILEGRDFPRISQSAGRINTMTLGGVSFGLSREQRARVEGEAQDAGDRALQGQGRRPGARLRLRRLHPARGGGEHQRAGLRAAHADGRRPGSARRCRRPVGAGGAGKSAVTVMVSGSVQLR
jgi:hypothetical protein